MGEAKRRRPEPLTFDGGPSSPEAIAVQVEIFSPIVELFSGDRLYLTAIRESCQRSFQRPGMICGACDYEFSLGEAPPLLWCTRPFIEKGPRFLFIAGGICPRCADRPSKALSDLQTNVIKGLKASVHCRDTDIRHPGRNENAIA